MTPPARNLRWGAFVPQGWKLEYSGIGAAAAWERSKEIAAIAERVGYDHLWVYDHVETVPRREATHVFEAFTMLSALSQLTSTIRLGQLVTCSSYRNVGLLAKEAACLDVYSGGRLILGLGAGWYDREYRAYGYSYPAAGVRLERLEETIQVVKRLWTEETVTFAGNHLDFDAAYCDPKPIQQLPPIWVGGGGEKKTLRIAACHADATNWQTGLPQFVHKSQVLREHCDAEGRDFDSITRTHGPDCRLFDSDADLRRWLDTPDGGSLWGRGDPDEYVRDNLVGTVEQVAEKVQGYVDAGCAEFVLWFRDFPSSESLERFMADVVPKVRGVMKIDEETPKPDPTQSSVPRRDPVLLTVVVVAVVLAGIAFRFVIKSQLWLDEALAVNVAHLPVRQIPSWLRHDGAPPVYYFLLHYWMKVFGTSNLAVRSLAGVFSVATFPLAWYAGKRTGGRRVAWIAVLVFAANPYAIIYATSVRMYSIEIFLVFAGVLAVWRAFERPSLDRLAVLAGLVAILIYTQYWGFYVVAAVGLFLLGTAIRSPAQRDAAVRMIASLAVGCATFAPWLPTFLYQAKHTGTPWGKPLLPPTPIGLTFQDFSGGSQHEGWIMLLAFVVLMFLGTFGRAVDGRHIDVDLFGQPAIRWEAAVGAAALVIGTSAAFASRSAFQSRYSSIVFPFFVLVVAHGVACFADRRTRVLVVTLVVALGFVGGVRNVTAARTSAPKVAAIIRKEAKPGDVVLYCPDQVGPAVHRLLPKGLDEVTYPKLRKPALVDWVDYKAVLRHHKPAVVAQQVLDLAGTHTIWYVSAPGYQTHVGTCDVLSDALAKQRRMFLRLAPDLNAFEHQGLKEFTAP